MVADCRGRCQHIIDVSRFLITLLLLYSFLPALIWKKPNQSEPRDAGSLFCEGNFCFLFKRVSFFIIILKIKWNLGWFLNWAILLGVQRFGWSNLIWKIRKIWEKCYHLSGFLKDADGNCSEWKCLMMTALHITKHFY